MQYVNLGRTGLKVSRLCLGTMTYGTPQWRPWVLSEDDSRPFIREALDAGINFFDTANMYSNGVSAQYASKARDAGYANLSADDLIRLQSRGVSFDTDGQ